MALKVLFLTVVMLFVLAEANSNSTLVGTDDQLQVAATVGNGTRVPVLDCAGLCGVRCSLHSRPNVCNRACGTCCFRCKCVPPGTSGNRETCGSCYTNMTTHGNRTKCP